MCIMEIHAEARRSTMVQAIAHNLSTIDRDLDMLLKVGESRKDRELVDFAQNLQNVVSQAYAIGLTEFGLYVASDASDSDGHIHRKPGEERNFVEVVNNATRAAKRDETR